MPKIPEATAATTLAAKKVAKPKSIAKLLQAAAPQQPPSSLIVQEYKPLKGWREIEAERLRAAEREEDAVKKLAARYHVNPHDHRPILASWVRGGEERLDTLNYVKNLVKQRGADHKLVTEATALQTYFDMEAGRKMAGPAITIVNEVGVEVTKTATGKNTIEGVTHTKFFLWAGAQGWSPSDVQSALATLGLGERSILSIRTFVYAGRGQKDGMAAQGRGPIPVFTPEQVERLNAARPATEPHPVETPLPASPIAKKKPPVPKK